MKVETITVIEPYGSQQSVFRNSGGHLPASSLVQIPALVSRVDMWSDRES